MLDPLRFAEMKASGRLPLPTGLSLELIEQLKRPDVSLPELCRLIQRDPALVGRLLQMANAAVYARPRPAAAITPDVLMMLGLPAVRNVELAFSLIDTHRKGASQRFDYDAFWLRSFAEASAAQAIGAAVRMVPALEMFTLGLLAELGQLALASWSPESYDAMAETLGPNAEAYQWLEAERATFGFDHTELAASLAADWGLPKLFQEALRWHALPKANWPFPPDERVGRLTAALALAHRLADTFFLDDAARVEALAGLQSRASALGIGEWLQLADAALKGWQEWSASFALDPPPRISFTELLARNGQKSSGLLVLVVDDDASTRQLTAGVLGKAGHTVQTAADGAQGLALVHDWLPDILVTDVLMPEINGIELIRRLRASAEGERVYIIVFTVLDAVESLVEAFAAGADDYVVKPLNAAVLLARIQAGVRLISLQQTLIEKNPALEEALRRAQEAALTDVLTGLRNRRYAIERLAQECASALRSDRPLSLLMIDIDHFKTINDRFGHAAGDSVLVEIARRLQATLRSSDIIARIGGEEFLVIAPDTPKAEAFKLAERLRQAVAARPVMVGQTALTVTISIGVADQAASGCQNTDQLLNAADAALYAAKAAGRNRVSF